MAGEVRWSYLPAVVFGKYSVEGSTLTGALVSVDDYRVTQCPLVAVVNIGLRKQIRWPIKSLQISGDTVTAVLGPRLEETT